MVTLKQIVDEYNDSFPAGYGPLSDGVPLPILDVATEQTQRHPRRRSVTRRIRKARS
jgi:hypothetical protein